MIIIIAVLVNMLLIGNVNAATVITGELKVWHPVILTFDGPNVTEGSSPNPFTSYRLDVTFTGPGGQVYKVPGYFAADGNAAETSATDGNKWRVKFSPDQAGTWTYSVSFVTGTNIAASLTGGTSAGYFNGASGSFSIAASDKSGNDFRGKGKIEYANDCYLKFKGTGGYFLKSGANSPETFLENTDIDSTPGDTNFSAMAAYWQAGDPVWKTNKGKGSIGIVNYLANNGANTHYFLMMNSRGDGKDCYPWRLESEYDRYDVSKLEQWDIIFSQFDKKGVMMNCVLSETENSSYFEIKENGSAGGFANSRKIFYREMIARFGYHLGITWNIGEEINWLNDNETTTSYGYPPTISQIKSFSDYIRSLTYYKDPIVAHNGPSNVDDWLDDLLGYTSFCGVSYQSGIGSVNHSKILEWRNKSVSNGHKWYVTFDEPYITTDTPDLATYRKQAIWGTYMAGGSGVELYSKNDQSITNYSGYANYYLAGQKAYNFFYNNVTELPSMVPNDSLVGTGNWCLAKSGQKYVVYLPNGGTTNLNLTGVSGNFNVKWYDPRNGGSLQNGSIQTISGGGSRSLGNAPNNTTSDWTVLITSSGTTPTPTPTPPPSGNGDGLTGEYYNNQDFTALMVTRVDPTINFNWGSSSPDPSVASTTFSVKWTGYIQAPSTGTYTFYVNSNDGNRLWVNNTQLTNRWSDGISEQSGTISLTAGQQYPITLEFYQGINTSSCTLSWTTPGGSKQVIPTAYLFSN